MAKNEKKIVKVENNAVEENNDAENSKADETNGEKENVSNETIKNENLESELNNNAPEENNDAEITKPDETKQDFAKKVETKPIWRIKVVAKFNRWSFNKWEEYEVSETVFKIYDWLFEVKGK